MNKGAKILVSGGGTAGHIYPALAVADALRERGGQVKFVGAKGKMEMERVPLNGYQIEGLPVAGIARSLSLRAILSNLAFPFRLWRSVRLAQRIIKRERPDVVVGFGGYASAPIVRAAQSLGVKTMLQEQNSYAGLANRMLGKRAEKIFVAYDNMDRFFDPEKIVFTGNPLRGNILKNATKKEAAEYFGLDETRRTIFITGGSLGTRTLNEMLFAYISSPACSKDDLQIIWQTGKIYIAEMERRLAELNFDKDRIKIMAFVERMDLAYALADVVVCRAGASTVSELQILGKAVVFVPSPVVAEDHQTKNAMAMSSIGAAALVEDSRALEEGMQAAKDILNDNEKRQKMEQAMRSLGRGDAATTIADIILKEVVGNPLI